MWALLAGVPGRLKTLIDRLTAARAANLDSIDATISSRAPANTALSTATWTGTRAANLDSIDAAVSTRMPGTTTHRDRIDVAISTRMPGTATHRDRIDTTVSSRAPASTALSTATWPNALAAALTAATEGGSVVKSVQSGYVSAAAAAGSGEDVRYLDVPISAVDASKCLVLFVGGASDSTSNAVVKSSTTIARVVECLPRLTSSTNLRIAQPGWGIGTVYITGRWTVIEFN